MSLTLTVSDIWKSYKGIPVLKGCSFSFDAGATYAVMGANGSGKSTFLRICALIENPAKGKVHYFYNSSAVKNDIELRRRVTLVLPGIGIFNTTALSNVTYGLKIRGIKKSEAIKRVSEALEFVGLFQKRNQNALTLSSGEAQRLGIARAVVIEPEILFLDEPTSSIDEKNTEIVEDIIFKMKQQRGTTIILTTHDNSQAERLAEKTLFIREGCFISR